MNIRIPLLLCLFIIVISCQEKKPSSVATEQVPKIIVKEVLASSQNCVPDSSNCTYVRIEYPEFTDSTKAHLNQIISKKLKASASDYIREETVEGTFEHIAQSFIRDYEAFKIDFPEYNFGWYVNLKAEIIYESERLVSFSIYAESFTGGAHPNSSTNYYVLNTRSNKELKMSDIIADTTKFKELLEAEFRRSKGMSDTQTFADMGYFINDGDFLLNDNIGLTSKSVIVQFNPYEIAPYSEGATTLELSKEELGDLLKVN